jgi:hypothetical protein
MFDLSRERELPGRVHKLCAVSSVKLPAIGKPESCDGELQPELSDVSRYDGMAASDI